jgi:hypothetical protein
MTATATMRCGDIREVHTMPTFKQTQTQDIALIAAVVLGAKWSRL